MAVVANLQGYMASVDMATQTDDVAVLIAGAGRVLTIMESRVERTLRRMRRLHSAPKTRQSDIILIRRSS